MRKINTMRAKLLHSTFETGACQCVSTAIVQTFFKNTPSYSETQKCVKCENVMKLSFHTVLLEISSFKNDLSKLENSIKANFAESGFCPRCKIQSARIVSRQYHDHLFIEVTYMCKCKC